MSAKEKLIEIYTASDPSIARVEFFIKRKQINEDQSVTLLCASVTTADDETYTYSVDYGRAWLGNDIVVFHRSICLSNVMSIHNLAEYYARYDDHGKYQGHNKYIMPTYVQGVTIELILLYIELLTELITGE